MLSLPKNPGQVRVGRVIVVGNSETAEIMVMWDLPDRDVMFSLGPLIVPGAMVGVAGVLHEILSDAPDRVGMGGFVVAMPGDVAHRNVPAGRHGAPEDHVLFRSGPRIYPEMLVALRVGGWRAARGRWCAGVLLDEYGVVGAADVVVPVDRDAAEGASVPVCLWVPEGAVSIAVTALVVPDLVVV